MTGVPGFQAVFSHKPFRMIISIPSNGSASQACFAITDTNMISQFIRMAGSRKHWGYENYAAEYAIDYYDVTGEKIETWYIQDNLKLYSGSEDPDIVRENRDSLVLIENAGSGKCRISRNYWNDLLKRADTIKSENILLMDLDMARQIRDYCKKNHIPFQFGEDGDAWMKYDGYFTFTAKRVGIPITEKEIRDNISENFPEDSFGADFYGWHSGCETDIGKRTLYWQTVTVKCSRDLYKKFKLYSPTTCYEYYAPEFNVFGTKEELKPVLKMADKAWSPWK